MSLFSLKQFYSFTFFFGRHSIILVEKWLFSTPLLFVNRFVTKFGANSVPFSAMASSPPEQTTFQRHGGKRLKRPRCLPVPPTSSSSSPPPPTFPSTITKTTRIQEPEARRSKKPPRNRIESKSQLPSPNRPRLSSLPFRRRPP